MNTLHVRYGENNLNQACANAFCGMARFKPKATFFHRHKKSWVCSTCAQTINREHVVSLRGNISDWNPPCINSETYLVEKLVGAHA